MIEIDEVAFGDESARRRRSGYHQIAADAVRLLRRKEADRRAGVSHLSSSLVKRELMVDGRIAI